MWQVSVAEPAKQDGKSQKFKVICGAIGGAAGLLATVGTGLVLSIAGANGAGGLVKPKATACEKERLGIPSALATKP